MQDVFENCVAKFTYLHIWSSAAIVGLTLSRMVGQNKIKFSEPTSHVM